AVPARAGACWPAALDPMTSRGHGTVADGGTRRGQRRRALPAKRRGRGEGHRLRTSPAPRAAEQHLRRALPPNHRPASLAGLALRVQGHFRGEGLLAGGRPRTVPGTVRLSHRTALATLARAAE